MKSKIDLVKAWLKKAENDLSAAENSIEAKLYDIASFHAQQCAEKYLKAFLTYHEIEFEKTHAIEDLLLLASQIDDSFVKLYFDSCFSKIHYLWAPLSVNEDVGTTFKKDLENCIAYMKHPFRIHKKFLGLSFDYAKIVRLFLREDSRDHFERITSLNIHKQEIVCSKALL